MNRTSSTRRNLLTGALMLTALPLRRPLAALAQSESQAAPQMNVTKSPSCGCCKGWVDLARQQGFSVSVTDTDDYEGMKTANAVPEALWSCHTAVIDGYVIEGHVPFAAIRTLLAERPDIAGLSVPGMPPDSPGMGGGADAVVPVTAWGGTAGDGTPFEFKS